MTDTKPGINPIAAAVTGAVVGAGLAVAGAVALKDENNAKKVKKVIENAKNQAADYAIEMQKHVQETKAGIEEKIADGAEIIEMAADAAKESLTSK